MEGGSSSSNKIDVIMRNTRRINLLKVVLIVRCSQR